jgi:ankyrin repeat protein
MASATSLTAAVRGLRCDEVARGLDERPDLLGHRDKSGRTWLHLCCSVQGAGDTAVPLAEALLDRGLGIDDPAFTEDEGNWHATPLWYAVGRGRNLPLATFLLHRGASPAHCLWAAAFSDDLAMIDLLVDHGADLEAVAEGRTPFIDAIGFSHFASAQHLLERGADPDAIGEDGCTALHLMVKKRSEPRHIRMVLDHGARTDIPGPDGRTVADVLSRARTPALRALLGSGEHVPPLA